ncbi:MAG: DMT family transporter [Thermodesulfobacteriota bacterium]
MIPENASPEPRVRPYFALVSGVIAVSTGAIFARLAEAPALVIAAYRVGLAAAILAPLAIWKVRMEIARLTRSDLALTVVSGIFLALHFATWISSLSHTSVASSVVLVNTNPIWVALMTPLITGERLNRASFISIVISVAGAGIMGAGDFVAGDTALWGDFLALVGGVCAAIYLLLGRRLRRKLSLLAYIFVCYASAAAVLWLMVLLLQLPVRGFGTSTWAAFVAMALFTQLVGHTSYNWALKWVSAGLIAVSLLGEPIGSSILAYFIFDEGLTWLNAAGGALILAAIYLAAVNEKAIVKKTASRAGGGC